MAISAERGIVTGILSLLLAACSGSKPDNLGVREGLLANCPSSLNCVSSQADDESHRIAPLACRSDPDADFKNLAVILRLRSDTTIIVESSGYLRVEFRTRFFVDDGEFFLDRERKAIQLRSASRLGYSDLGKNRSRIEEIRREFERRGVNR